MALVGSGVMVTDSTVVTAVSLTSILTSCTASLEVGMGLVTASSSSSEGPVATFAALISGSGFDVVASGVSVGSGVDEAGMLANSEFSITVEEPCVFAVDTESTSGEEAVGVTSGISEDVAVGSVFCA